MTYNKHKIKKRVQIKRFKVKLSHFNVSLT